MMADKELVVKRPECIELVIKISEDSYKATCNGWMLPPDVENVVQGIKNGTPLPKGHGRLIDADALNISHGVFVPKVKGNAFGCPMDAVFIDEINDAPTIIEADR
jgi:hypothetical protein